MFSTTSWMLLHPLLLIFSNSLGAASPTKNIVKRVDLPADISAWSAFGDSYASGLGAGTLVTEKDSIYSGSYPQQMNNNDPRIGNAASRKFQDLAHSGSNTGEVIAGAQSNDISASELVTVQIAGNDLPFYNIMSGCVFRFEAELSIGCATALQQGQAHLDNDVPGAMDNVIAALLKAAPNLDKLIVVGYGAPFNQDTTGCNTKFWNFWYFDAAPDDLLFLTTERRRSLNDIISNLNSVLSAAVDRANSGAGAGKVAFADWNPKYNGHRFCEVGVDERPKNRDNAWFYNVPTVDDGDLVAAVDDQGSSPDPSTCKATAEASGSWTDLMNCGIARVLAAHPDLIVPQSGLFGLFGPNNGRIGHPKPQGHLAIADAIFEAAGRTGPGGFKAGWCGFHVTQYQKDNPSDPNSHYHLDVSVKDASGAVVGTVGYQDAPSGQSVHCSSRLPNPVVVTAQNVDADALLFQYGGQHFGSNDQAHHCNFGAYDSGKREGDCGFSC